MASQIWHDYMVNSVYFSYLTIGFLNRFRKYSISYYAHWQMKTLKNISLELNSFILEAFGTVGDYDKLWEERKTAW